MLPIGQHIVQTECYNDLHHLPVSNNFMYLRHMSRVFGVSTCLNIHVYLYISTYFPTDISFPQVCATNNFVLPFPKDIVPIRYIPTLH